LKTQTKIASGEAIPTGDKPTLPLRELEAFSRSRLPVLLAFFHARIARQKSFLLQYSTKLRTEFNQGPRDAVLYSAGLAVHTPAIDSDNNVEFVQGIGCFQGPLHQHAVGFIEEVLFQGSIVDSEGARTGPKNYTGGGRFSAARAVVLN
jgi:hypothetical protein